MTFVSGCDDCILCLVVMGLWTVTITSYSKHSMIQRLDLSPSSHEAVRRHQVQLTQLNRQPLVSSPVQNSTVFEVQNSSNTERMCQFIPYSYTIFHLFVEGLKFYY